MQHIHVMMFYPGGVSSGYLPEDHTDQDILDMVNTAVNIEEGNGNGKIKKRERPVVDAEPGRKARRKR